MIFAVLSLFSHGAYSKTYSKIWGSASYASKYKDLLYMAEPQVRVVDTSEKYEMSLLNAGIGKTIIPDLQLWFGQTYINYALRNNIEEDVNLTTSEYRIWEQLLWRRPFNDELASRTRLEQRRAFQSSNWALRLRERAYWTKPINDKYSFIVNDEVFLNLTYVPWVSTAFLDQNRGCIGLLFKISSDIGLAVSYMNQYIPRVPIEYNNAVVFNLMITG
jgi:hypothetical protein